METRFKDIFSIENPESYVCIVSRYISNDAMAHMHLIVRPQANPKHFFGIYFPFVYFYCGPMGWSGAHFRTGTEDECLSILRRTYGFERYFQNESGIYSPATLADRYKLYISGTPELEVKIISHRPQILLAGEF